MGMAEEIIAEPNFEKLCSNIIDSDNQIRFAAFVNDKSKILHSAQRDNLCLLYTSPSPRDLSTSRMPSSA